MNQAESFSNPSCSDQIHLAARELSAFIAAVSELFGAEQARASAEDWLDESELMELSPRSTRADWRAVTIAASVRLANRLNVALHRQRMASNISCYPGVADAIVQLFGSSGTDGELVTTSPDD